MESDLVLIHIGPEFPTYMNECIHQAQSVNTHIQVHVLVSKEHIDKVAPKCTVVALEDIPSDEFMKEFEHRCTLNKDFRNGFWKYTTMRFFYIYNYITMKQIRNVFHIEYDNLLYYDYTQKLNIFSTKPMWMVFDSPSRCIPSFMYIRESTDLKQLLTFINSNLSEGKNDMQTLSDYRNTYPEDVGCLPIIYNYAEPIDTIFKEHAELFGVLFDGACVGQYIGGVDPRNIPGNTTGFINETTVFRCDRAKVTWSLGKVPYLNGMKLVNLHIHSKELHRWTNYSSMDILSGERIQEICDVYCGRNDDLHYNPRITSQTEKHVTIESTSSPWNNPRLIFCYAHRISDFIKISLPNIQNPFVLITHNSDENITEKYAELFDNPKLIHMFSQNLCVIHPKVSFLPIGIANSMWPHGNIMILKDVMKESPIQKTKDVYFYFSLHTNYTKRSTCKSIIESKGLVFDSQRPYKEYLIELAKYRFAICPEGNGADSHRLWECYYLGVVPILLRSTFSLILQKHFPCILLESWNDFTVEMAYEYFTGESLSLAYYMSKVRGI
jgi:hypothetical protein